jgi:hypothetical protein
MQLVHQDAKEFFNVAVRSNGSGHADERFVSHGKSRCRDDLQVVVHVHRRLHCIKRIPVHLMPSGAQLIHVAGGEKDALVPVISSDILGKPEQMEKRIG